MPLNLIRPSPSNDKINVKAYENGFPVFQQLYKSLKEDLRRIAKLQYERVKHLPRRSGQTGAPQSVTMLVFQHHSGGFLGDEPANDRTIERAARSS
jgi:hypothetical protein